MEESGLSMMLSSKVSKCPTRLSTVLRLNRSVRYSMCPATLFLAASIVISRVRSNLKEQSTGQYLLHTSQQELNERYPIQC